MSVGYVESLNFHIVVLFLFVNDHAVPVQQNRHSAGLYRTNIIYKFQRTVGNGYFIW